MSGDSNAWRPVSLDELMLATLTEDPRIEIVDTVAQQRRHLSELLPAPQDSYMSELTRWFYYPWRRSVVHLLGPEGFQALRADRNRNKITSEEQQQLRHQAVGVVGLSSGYAIALAIALEGICGQIRLSDFDEIELSNLNRIPGTVFDLHVNKAVVAARRIAELDPYIDVAVNPAGLDAGTLDEFMDGLDVVVEQCDSFDVKVAVREAARRLRVPVVMATADRGLFDVERFDLEPDRRTFHGLLGDVPAHQLKDMALQEKVPYVERVLEPTEISVRMAESMAEVGRTVSTWPQLGADIYLGAATAAAAVRLLGLKRPIPSGRIRVDLDEMLTAMASQTTSRAEVSRWE